jgi:enoyl-CoA hydratase
MDMLIVGTPITGQRAYDVGLVGHVTPKGGALAKAREVADILAANGPLAVRNIKASVIENLELKEADAFQRELELGMEVMSSKDAREGPKAFLEKRAPNFIGE